MASTKKTTKKRNVFEGMGKPIEKVDTVLRTDYDELKSAYDALKVKHDNAVNDVENLLRKNTEHQKMFEELKGELDSVKRDAVDAREMLTKFTNSADLGILGRDSDGNLTLIGKDIDQVLDGGFVQLSKIGGRLGLFELAFKIKDSAVAKKACDAVTKHQSDPAMLNKIRDRVIEVLQGEVDGNQMH